MQHDKFQDFRDTTLAPSLRVIAGLILVALPNGEDERRTQIVGQARVRSVNRIFQAKRQRDDVRGTLLKRTSEPAGAIAPGFRHQQVNAGHGPRARVEDESAGAAARLDRLPAERCRRSPVTAETSAARHKWRAADCRVRRQRRQSGSRRLLPDKRVSPQQVPAQDRTWQQLQSNLADMGEGHVCVTIPMCGPDPF